MASYITELRDRDGDDCGLCDKPIDFTRPAGTWLGPSVDHVVPRAAGGRTVLANLQLAHAFPCNHSKGATHNGVDFAKLSDPGQSEERKAEVAAGRAQRAERIWFESYSAAKPH